MKLTRPLVIVARVFLPALLLVAVAAQPALAQSDQLIGTWKLNLAKSKYTTGQAPRSESVTYTAAGQGATYKVTQTDASGKPVALDGSLHYDGKDYPAGGTQDYDTVATRKIDAYTGETTRKKSGKVVQTVTRVVSADGKTLTLTTKGVTAKGESIANVAVYERQ